MHCINIDTALDFGSYVTVAAILERSILACEQVEVNGVGFFGIKVLLSSHFSTDFNEKFLIFKGSCSVRSTTILFVFVNLEY